MFALIVTFFNQAAEAPHLDIAFIDALTTLLPARIVRVSTDGRAGVFSRPCEQLCLLAAYGRI
jgi:hypothetical protein